MKSRRIRNRLLVGFAIVVGIIAAQGVLELWRSTRVETLLREALVATVREDEAAEAMLSAALRIRIVLGGDESISAQEREQINSWIKEIQNKLQEGLLATRESRNTLADLNAREREKGEDEELDQLAELQDEILRFEAVWNAGAGEDIAVMRALLDKTIIPGLTRYDEKSGEDISAEMLWILRLVEGSRWILIVTMGAAILAASLACVLLTRMMVSPLEEMTVAVQRISEGEDRHRIPERGEDEFGTLGRAFNRMLDTIQVGSVKREELESLVRERTQELDQFFMLSVEMLCIADFSGKFLRVNRAFEETLGYFENELISQPFLEFIHPDDRASTMAEMEKYVRRGEPSLHFENRYRHKDGSWRQLSWNAMPVPESGLVYAAARDVTAAKQAEKALRESEQNLAITLESIGDGVLVTDGDGRITRMNRVAEDLTGWTLREAAGRPVCEIFHIIHEHTREAAVIPVATALETGKIVELANHTALISRDGTERSIADSAAPIRDPAGAVVGVVLVFRDVTREREAQELAQARTEEILRFQRAQLTLRDAEYDELSDFLRLASRICAESLDVERVSIWFFNPEKTSLECLDLYEEPEARHSSGMVLARNDFESYFAAIEAFAPVVATEASRHPATGCFADDYLSRLGIVSMLDIPIRTGSQLVGVLCCEHRRKRTWAPSEVKFASSIAGAIMLAVEHDEREEAERKLRKSEGFNRSIVQSTEDCLKILSLDGRLLDMAEQGKRVMEVTDFEPLRNADWVSFWKEEDRPRVRQAIERARNGDMGRFQGPCPTMAGTMKWWDVIVTAIEEENGEPDRLLAVSRDITHQRAVEEQLRELNANLEQRITERTRELAQALEAQQKLTRQARAGEKAKTEFLAVMSHEVRTPMNGIIGFADLLARSPELSGENHEFAQIVCQSSKALLRILDDILDFSSSMEGALKISPAPFSLPQLLREVGDLLRPVAEQKDLDLEVSISADIPEKLVGDAGRLRQIVLNLVGNALKFTERGSISLFASRAMRQGDDLWRITVRDTGRGISEEEQKSIFDPFTQTDRGASRRYGGTGLGLAISKKLAGLMGGELTLKSETGRGSEFILELPMPLAAEEIHPPASRPGAKHDSSFAQQHPLRILVVEDERVNLKLTLTMLKKLGYEAMAATNGEEAVRIFKSEKPNCILMDLQMPEMDGFEATVRIRKMEKASVMPPSYISALTANTVAADKERCFQVGMSAYLNKPIRPDRLGDLLIQAGDHLQREHLKPVV